jgi:DNA-directed RNA polymerase specialized sigma24 family protein
LRGLAHALLLDPGRVDAVLRVAYVRAWREVVRIDPRQNAAAWLYRLVYNACIDGLRRESTRIGAAPPAAPELADTAGTAGTADAADADAAVASADPPVEPEPAGGNGDRPATTSGRSPQVVEALATLAPADRVAVVLVDREGFAPETAARILGLTPEVLQTRVVGARARLTKQLADVLAAPATPTAPAGEAAPAGEDGPEPQPDEAESEAETEAQSEEPQPVPEQSESDQPDAEQPPADPSESDQPEADQPPAEQPEAELDDATSADAAETKVASRSAAGGSPNGSSGAPSTNGSDDAGGSAS